MAPDKHRYHMCRLAVKDYPCFEVSDIELKRKTKSYTYDTLAELKSIYEDAELFLIMGSDMFLTFMQWYRAAEMLSMATLLTAAREPGEMKMLVQCQQKLEQKGGKSFILDVAPMVISSTEIRGWVKSGKSLAGYLDENVIRYINQHGLYAD